MLITICIETKITFPNYFCINRLTEKKRAKNFEILIIIVKIQETCNIKKSLYLNKIKCNTRLYI